VKKGAPLFRIDPVPYGCKVSQARAKLLQVKEEGAGVLANVYATNEALRRAEANLDVARQAVAAAKAGQGGDAVDPHSQFALGQPLVDLVGGGPQLSLGGVGDGEAVPASVCWSRPITRSIQLCDSAEKEIRILRAARSPLKSHLPAGPGGQDHLIPGEGPVP
jgi:multidrug efflux pump subunit AcrA (membrane-fusion protein)